MQIVPALPTPMQHLYATFKSELRQTISQP
jgi:hypothetical protein